MAVARLRVYLPTKLLELERLANDDTLAQLIAEWACLLDGGAAMHEAARLWLPPDSKRDTDGRITWDVAGNAAVALDAYADVRDVLPDFVEATEKAKNRLPKRGAAVGSRTAASGSS